MHAPAVAESFIWRFRKTLVYTLRLRKKLTGQWDPQGRHIDFVYFQSGPVCLTKTAFAHSFFGIGILKVPSLYQSEAQRPELGIKAY